MIQKTKDKIFIFSQKFGKKMGLDLPYFIKNGFWMTARQIVDMVNGLLIYMAFARLSNSEIFGQYQFVIAAFSIVSIVSLPGINNAIVRSVARGYEGDYKLGVKESFRWSLLGIPLLFLFGLFSFYFSGKAIGIGLMISSIFIPFFNAPNSWNAFLQGKDKYSLIFIFSFYLSMISSFATVVAVAISKDNVVPIIFVYLISYTAFNMFFYFKSLKLIDNDNLEGDTISYGKFLTRISLFELISDNLDKIIVGMLLGPSVLAAFSIISLIPSKLKSVFKSIFSIILPKMSTEKFKLEYFLINKKKLLVSLFIIVIFGGIFYYFTIEKINRLFFGYSYDQFYALSSIFSVSIVLSIPTIFLRWYVQAKKLKEIITYTNPVYFLVKIVPLFIGAYFWGLWGVVIAYNVNYILLIFLYFILIKYRKIV